MKDIVKLADSLQDNEIKVLQAFKGRNNEIAELKGLPKNEFLRAGMWLDNKGLIKTHKDKTRFIQLDLLGEKYVKSKLPELALLAVLSKKPHSLQDLKVKFPQDELRFAIGYLKGKGYLEFRHGVLSITDTGLKVKVTLEFKFLLKLAKFKELKVEHLLPEDQYSYQQLKRRKQLTREIERVSINFSITDLGKEVLQNLSSEKRIGMITSQIIKTGSWKDAKFRRYDVSAPVPKIYPGKKQPYYQFIDDVKARLVKIGFQEMTGPIVETEFWHFDAMFQPQNHPARNVSDTYSIKNVKYGKLPDKRIVNAIRDSHETGGKTGSIGWRYKWDEKIASQLLPRGHATCLSARQLAKGVKSPSKYFSVARCYRPDILDATHLIEFNQVEGIVTGKVNFKHLLGVLKQFAIEFAGAEEVEFIPDYYPFTEPSVQMNVKHPKLGWIELGGAGIFRPEFTEALGIKDPVLAWGIGIDRLAMCKLGINDIRYIFSQDLNWLRKEKIVK
ncbi:phenylalanine--tRNA ligase subunit alpha [Candidatus Woesearchaeota archaeon]|jgi:phenylalanyl-tRNA synthetase alpha chain|nr:phenylalanine--tRNA ligase subunit alpha [Candidatus Woesearchaeota archaeon]MBT7062698.1 phenylalanine--tRNA ligase subunit alpha [Candidatus Woesearchaeota archaeon]MBT7402469.1 phenylalanine--tRNA ligase subunit alpha [Candidatus Woesearchaeota archaeon]